MKTTDLQVAKKFLNLRASANKRGIEFDLSLRSVRNLLSAKRCYYTRVELDSVEGSPNQRTIDRVDNSKGYVVGNVVACCCSFNSRKNDLTVREIKILYNKVIGR